MKFLLAAVWHSHQVLTTGLQGLLLLLVRFGLSLLIRITLLPTSLLLLTRDSWLPTGLLLLMRGAVLLAIKAAYFSQEATSVGSFTLLPFLSEVDGLRCK